MTLSSGESLEIGLGEDGHGSTGHSMVTGCTAGLGMNLKLFPELFAKLFSGLDAGTLSHVFSYIFIAILKVEDLFQRTQMLFGSTVTVEAPTH